MTPTAPPSAPRPPTERCPGTGTQYLPVYHRLPSGREVKQLRSCAACGRLTYIDARRPWMPWHKRPIGQTYESFWRRAGKEGGAE